MTTKMSAFRSLLLVTAVSLVAGCGSQFKDFCTQKAQCEGGNDKDINACVAEAEGAYNEEKAYECQDPMDKLVDCWNNKGICKEGHYGADCSDAQTVVNACQKAATGRK